jgi:hypothetical protein
MQATLPPAVRSLFHDPATLKGLLVLLGFLLRLWTIVGELMLLVLAYIWDYRGGFNLPGAPGRDSNDVASQGLEPLDELSRVDATAA